MRTILSIMFFQLLFISCQKASVPTPEEVLQKAVQAHGGEAAFEPEKKAF